MSRPTSAPARTRARLVALALATALAAVVPGEASAQGAPCATPEHRAFDFWAGTWEVRRPDGQVVGHNRIERTLGGCVLHERYTTPRGYEGESLNIFDARRGVWHQTWTDNGGLLLRLEGGLEGEAMVMRGEILGRDGEPVLQRITWSRVDGDPDRVRQHWEQSSDGGETWTTAFDGLYLREAGEGSGPGRAP